jgi:hypothetical protein
VAAAWQAHEVLSSGIGDWASRGNGTCENPTFYPLNLVIGC